MVLPLIITVGLIAVVVLFQKQIKAFADDLRSKANDPENIEKQKVIDERGAVANTQAFFLGEKGLEDLKKSDEQRQIAVDQFIKDSQAQIDLGLQGVNTSLVEAQANLTKFAQESQANIVKTVDDSSKAFNESISGVGDNITNFFTESAVNLQNIFGGQSTPKAVATSISPTPALTTKTGTPVIDLSFLTPDTSFTPDEQELEVEATTSRFSGSGSRR